MFCASCGKLLQNDMTFCPYCGAETRRSTVETQSKDTTLKKTSVVVDTYTLITIFLSLFIIVSSAFLDVFRLVVKQGRETVRVVFKVFGGYAFSNNESVMLEGAEYDFPLANIMFIFLILSSVFAILFACMKKRYGTVICGFLNIFILFVGFLIFCFAISSIFESYTLMAHTKKSIVLMRLPGIGFIISFVLSAVMSFVGIFTATSDKEQEE